MISEVDLQPNHPDANTSVEIEVTQKPGFSPGFGDLELNPDSPLADDGDIVEAAREGRLNTAEFRTVLNPELNAEPLTPEQAEEYYARYLESTIVRQQAGKFLVELSPEEYRQFKAYLGGVLSDTIRVPKIPNQRMQAQLKLFIDLLDPYSTMLTSRMVFNPDYTLKNAQMTQDGSGRYQWVDRSTRRFSSFIDRLLRSTDLAQRDFHFVNQSN